MTRIIDFHTHFFSRTFFDTLATLSPQPGTVDEKLETNFSYVRAVREGACR